MPIKRTVTSNLQRDTLRKIATQKSATPLQRELAALRVQYSEDSKLLTGSVNQLIDVGRIFPTHLPTQKSGRWSTLNPPITNWPRACINQHCVRGEHEWTDMCWSIRDILLCDSDEVLVTWDHDNIEGRIHDLIVNDEVALQAHREGYDLHTLTCCDIFGMEYPSNKKNPHTSEEDSEWRHKWDDKHGGWQGKDTRVRVLAKNFNHGSKYTETYKFVHKIQGIEKYGVSYTDLERLAKRYIASKGEAWQRKLDIMGRIRKERLSRSLYGFRRVFFDSSAETGREGFSHMISATVSDYNNMTLQLLEQEFGEYGRLLHNAHDGDKYAVKHCIVEDGRTQQEWLSYLCSIIQRPISYENRSVVMTAGVKMYI